MATVIKAQQIRLPQGAAFQFDDLAHQAQGYIDNVQQKAREILAQAQHEAQAIRQKAEKEGREAGQRAIQDLVAKQVGQEMKTALPALSQAIDELTRNRQAWLAHWEQRAIHLATAIAGRVVRREVERTPEISLTLVREALEMTAGQSQIVIRMNPEDQKILASQLKAISAETERLGTFEIVADDSISRGGCRLETRHGAVDQRLETQLARIEAELAGS